MAARLLLIRHASRFFIGSLPSHLSSLGVLGQKVELRRELLSSTSMGLLRGFSAAGLPPHTLMTMPSLSPTMEQGNIASWNKKEGDTIAPGDVLAEIETDKATMEWEAQEEGFLAKILAGVGAKNVPVGTAVAILVDEESQVAAFKDYVVGAEAAAADAPVEPPPAAPAAAAAATAAAAAPASDFPPHQVLGMPSLSPTMSEGNIVEWSKKVGDAVAPGDVLCEVETDKATVSWEAQEEGFLAQILVGDGVTGIEVGAPVAVIVDEEELVAAFAAFSASDIGGAPAAPAAATTPPPPAPAPAATAAPVAASSPAAGRSTASPYAKKLAASQGIDITSVSGSGPGGRVTAADVAKGTPASPPSAAASAPAARSSVPGTGHTDTPHTQIRRITAARLLESKQTVPHYYLTAETQVDSLMALRAQINEALAASGTGVKVSLNDLVIKAAALALKEVPGVNASWHDDFVRQYNNVDISVAVQTPIGLMVPIVTDADVKSLAEISVDVRQLAAKAKEGKLKPAEFTGGTFTISNLGMMGVKQFCAIINPPQAAILAVGTVNKKLYLGPSGTPLEMSTLIATLSCDHRVVDGAMGAEWLAAFKKYIEKPLTMLV